jgi:Flp pilus assembly protein TadD
MIAADTAGYVGYWFTGVHVGRNGRMDQALTLLERAYARYPRDRGLQLDYADALVQNGQHARAAAIATELMRDPKFQAKPTAVAVYLDATGRTFGADSVVAAARRLMALTPSPTAVLFLGQAHAVRGDSAAAIAIYRDGLRAFPGDSVLRSRLDSLGATP